MAKEFYIPVNGFSKKTSKFYAPVNGFSKEIVKAYCSVNGFSKLFYEKGGGILSDNWEFYETLANVTCQTIARRKFFKRNIGIAYYGIAVYLPQSQKHTVPVFASTDEDAIQWNSSDGSSGNTGTRTTKTINGDTWYFSGFRYGFDGGINNYEPQGCYISDFGNDFQPAVDTLLSRIYSNCFAEDYQVGQTYNLSLGDIEKTIRKTIGVFLFKFVLMKGTTAYDTLLANVDTVVDNILNRCESGGYDKIIIGIQISSLSFTVQVKMTNLSIDSSTSYPQITSRTSRNGYDFVGTNSFIKPQYQINHVFNNNGMTINEQTLTPSYNSYIIGMRVESDSVGSSNVGLNL